MIRKLIGKKENGIEIKLYLHGGLQIRELLVDDDIDWSVDLTSKETKELKKFLDENLK